MVADIEARVLRNTRLSKDYNVVELAAPEIAAATQPGQFVMVKPGRGADPLLRRPFSVFEMIYDERAQVVGLSLLSKRIGVTTAMLYDLVEGDRVSCLGPLGRPFELVDPPTEAWMVAGGVGLAPFATLTMALRAHGTPMTLFYADWFDRPELRLVFSTEDGTRGERGRVTSPLDRELQGARGRDIMIYACGPEPMLEAVAAVAQRHGRRCQVSVERVMGCGMGGCYSCVVPLRDGHGGHRYVRSCLSGPVFAGADVVWD